MCIAYAAGAGPTASHWTPAPEQPAEKVFSFYVTRKRQRNHPIYGVHCALRKNNRTDISLHRDRDPFPDTGKKRSHADKFELCSNLVYGRS
ncbi:hypothetical protein, partial [Acidithiobacillus caldus]|uniref:hypothetical protein n=1 Tax=Acidithiobacillus caldus TaxID=33059 RepID=UPI001C07C3A8